LLCLPAAARKLLLRLPRRLLLLLKLLRLLKLLLPKPLRLLMLPLRPLTPLLRLLRPKPRSNLGNEVDSAKPAQAGLRLAGLFYWQP
jgi:hypothetical protein